MIKVTYIVFLQSSDIDGSLYISLLLINGTNEDLVAITTMSNSVVMNMYICYFIGNFHNLATCISILPLLCIDLIVVSEVAPRYCLCLKHTNRMISQHDSEQACRERRELDGMEFDQGKVTYNDIYYQQQSL